MGAADAVPGVSGGTIAFITGIYEELINSIKNFGPSVWGAWRRGGLKGAAVHLNLGFVIPLVLGIGVSLVSVAHLVTYLLDNQRLLLDAFFFGLVAASAWVVSRRLTDWRILHVLPLVAGLLLADGLPALMPLVSGLGSEGLMFAVAGAIAISAMLLPGISGSFLLLTMGLYSNVMEGIKSFDVVLMAQFGLGCLVGLMTFSRLLSWLLSRFHTGTLQLLIGFILGSLPLLWPWRELVSYRLGPDAQIIPMEYRYLLPNDYAQLTGDPSALLPAVALMLGGLILVLAVGRFASPAGSH
jgi:putative membrane protein